MNFLEKYIQRQEKKSAKHSLLQTYLISLISLSLTVTMLLGHHHGLVYHHCGSAPE